MFRWPHLIAALGLLSITIAVGQTARGLADEGLALRVALDLVLIGGPGLALVYIGRWLPDSDIDTDLHARIVAWGVGGVAVMFAVIVLRVLHPGVSVDFALGTIEVSLATGSVAGLLVGVHEARATTHARRLERQNETLKRAHEVERRNEELRRTQAQLEAAVTQLERSNERLEQFAYAASHDLQEPLRMVSSYLQLLDRRYGDELDADGREFLGYAVDGADRMRATVEGLLAYSRVETQGEPFESVDLDGVLAEALADLRVKIGETGAEVVAAPLPTVEGDAGQLRQVFQNLVGNALEYADGPPRVHVSAERAGARWLIAVRDGGIGIAPDEQERIFGLFQRLHAADEHEGSGIGLAMCKRIVERHGGEIRVDSVPGEGAMFSFTIPDGPGPFPFPAPTSG
ncbi:sensor histidine kinase [Salinilacihabitans rarus]|uniref:sensor histidine kinase n=1 Tax=Salinilacihabitans rarus TaxID=2961596 RepID=UPI0020C8751C|nr:ATP-binding protein [Salinilacihabitans rarus]